MIRHSWRAAAALIAAVMVTACSSLAGGLAGPDLSGTSATLEGLRVLPRRPAPSGFDRSCRAGHDCVFGAAWSDDVDVARGHDSCSTRDGILRSQLTRVRVKAGTRGCVVVEGDLVDPYTGDQIHFDKNAADRVEIDHV